MQQYAAVLSAWHADTSTRKQYGRFPSKNNNGPIKLSEPFLWLLINISWCFRSANEPSHPVWMPKLFPAKPPFPVAAVSDDAQAMKT